MSVSPLHRIHNNLGTPIKSTFAVEVEDGETSIIVEARGGSIGASNERNAEYTKGVDLILSRLAEIGCRLSDALIDTRTTAELGLSREERRLRVVGAPFPISLDKVADFGALRRDLCAAQRSIARKPDAKGHGNNNKRMRLFIEGAPANNPDTLALLIAIARPLGLASEDDLHSQLLSLHPRVSAATGGQYRPNYFLRAVRNKGGLKVAQDLLSPSGESAGFEKLVKVRRADLSVEAIALSERFSHLFNSQELETARARLAKLPPEAFPSYAGEPAAFLADELRDDEVFIEGAVKTVVVNRYERDRKARAACLKHFGPKCQACGINFAEIYGADIGEGFMHVHHIRPLESIGAAYRVDPKRDLVPVCPNCHAMLHRRNPPFDVEQLRGRLARR